jgi:hypothetical protein
MRDLTRSGVPVVSSGRRAGPLILSLSGELDLAAVAAYVRDVAEVTRRVLGGWPAFHGHVDRVRVA